MDRVSASCQAVQALCHWFEADPELAVRQDCYLSQPTNTSWIAGGKSSKLQALGIAKHFLFLRLCLDTRTDAYLACSSAGWHGFSVDTRAFSAHIGLPDLFPNWYQKLLLFAHNQNSVRSCGKSCSTVSVTFAGGEVR